MSIVYIIREIVQENNMHKSRWTYDFWHRMFTCFNGIQQWICRVKESDWKCVVEEMVHFCQKSWKTQPIVLSATHMQNFCSIFQSKAKHHFNFFHFFIWLVFIQSMVLCTTSSFKIMVWLNLVLVITENQLHCHWQTLLQREEWRNK